MRGKGWIIGSMPSRGRITPACAGKRPRQHSLGGRDRDHPRVCGEKDYIAGKGSYREGSPPRVRGKDVVVHHGDVKQGITPACAGKSPWTRWERNAQWDHPRVCGEKSWFPPKSTGFSGSPPRVRGKGWGWRILCRMKRITPACAGKSGIWLFWCWALRDHPRVCGEKYTFGCQKVAERGSPPRVRGKERMPEPETEVLGITPACAGKSRLGFQRFPAARDHPRVCGEKWPPRPRPHGPAGSPPRVRGKVMGDGWSVCWRGITPACAGKSGC